MCRKKFRDDEVAGCTECGRPKHPKSDRFCIKCLKNYKHKIVNCCKSCGRDTYSVDYCSECVGE